MLAPSGVEGIQSPGFPGGDRRRGVEAVLQGTLGGLRREWSTFRVEVEELLLAAPAGDAPIVALGRYVAVHAASGREAVSVFAHVYDVEEGRITRYRQFADTLPLAQAAAP